MSVPFLRNQEASEATAHSRALPSATARRRVPFAALAVSELSSDEELAARAYYYDTKTPGLELRVTPNGVKTFNVYRWHTRANRPIRVTIGKFPDIDIQDARKAARELVPQICQGGDPNAEKRALRAEATLDEVFRLLLETDFKVHNKTWQKYEDMYEAYLGSLAHHKLSSITRQQVVSLHTHVGTKNGKFAANRTIQMLRAVFNRAINLGFKGENPAKGIRLFKEQSRTRFLEADELPRFFEALNKLTYPKTDIPVTPDFKDFVLLSLLTGARQSNLLAMRWEDIHWEKAEWTIPMTKNGTSQRVVLVDQAVKILKARQIRLTSLSRC